MSVHHLRAAVDLADQPKLVYIAGPMTGFPKFNFPAFHEAADRLYHAGYEAVNPADLDDPAQRRAAESSTDGSIDEYQKITGMTWADFLARDVKLITDEVDALALLPGWEDSKGAQLEKHIADLAGKPCYDYDAWTARGMGTRLEECPLEPSEPQEAEPMNLLQEADKIVRGARRSAYGTPLDNARQFAEIGSAATGHDLVPMDYPVLMICVKLARFRGAEGWHRDTWVDIAGYARVAELIHEEGG
jgi:hypothetical protein